MNKFLPFLILALILTLIPPVGSSANTTAIQLGSDVLFNQFHHLIEGKKVGLITNQTGLNSQMVSTIDVLRRDRSVQLTALYAPEHGLDGKTVAGKQVTSFVHPVYAIPVYGLSGSTRKPTPEMLKDIDILLVDLQDIGSRTYTYISTLHYAMTAAKEQGKEVIVLDRPNPLGGTIVEGPIVELPFRSFIGVDTLPLAHGMTIGELALFFNRTIGVDLTVIPMQGYTRNMIYQQTGLAWIPSSPHIPSLTSVFGYMATGLGEGTPIRQGDNFTWIGAEGLDSYKYADLLNGSLLPGVIFIPENKGTAGGVRLQINDLHQFNPAKTGIYALAYAKQLQPFSVPKSTSKQIAMFDKVMGTNKIGLLLEQGKTPQEIVASYEADLKKFAELRQKYLIYGDEPFIPLQPIQQKQPKQPNKPAPSKPEKPKTPTPPQPGKDGTTNQTKKPEPTTQPIPQTPKTSEKIAYLTFDDGPSPVTLRILDTLKEHQVKATFFIVGREVAGHEAILKRIVAEGHAVGGHSYSHNYQLVYKNMESFFADLEKGSQMIEKATGVKPTVFRYPGGSTNTVSLKYQDPKRYNKQHTVMNAIKAEAKQRGYTFIDWNVTNGDARSNKYTAAQTLANIKQQVKSQKEIVVLMHDSSTKSPTAEALSEIISFLKEKGYRFEVIQADHPTVSNVK
ncbi:exo-beta-N-acetylmuramidase NamZ domain-containing protein [Brevibacillus fortis]|uniref:Polysaccharide deacetylase n=1 Tax=Brevibacillus fortis TaxID=2126352 RepID=A0A2P7VAW7_9BACL|nr:exo-beta-N-acetylmuramidase NamZ domain-containing protein [Brevibacillus fortis]PSJ96359.1 polysaccharide deacetylase [Brevibacillus fortis]